MPAKPTRSKFFTLGYKTALDDVISIVFAVGLAARSEAKDNKQAADRIEYIKRIMAATRRLT